MPYGWAHMAQPTSQLVRAPLPTTENAIESDEEDEHVLRSPVRRPVPQILQPTADDEKLSQALLAQVCVDVCV